MNQHAGLSSVPIPFIDVGAQRRRLGTRIDAAVARVLDHCQFIMGPEVRTLEAQLAAFCGAPHAISCASGTDALVLVLMALGIGRGDAVLCPSFTFCATAEAVALVGATPVFIDVEEASFNLDPAGIARGIAAAKAQGLHARAIIPVDLFGLPADYDAIAPIAAAAGLTVIGDAAQSFGATYKGRKVGALSAVSATSFFPAKPLGCFGDGGAIFTDDADLAGIIESIRAHGQGSDRYDNVRIGMTGRLDTIQAAILIEKLAIFPEEIEIRQQVARRYAEALDSYVAVPRIPGEATSVFAQYTIRLKPGMRERFAAALRAEGVPTAIYYAKPLHRQQAYREYPVAEGGLPVSERLAEEVISLPMHAYLDEAVQDRIVGAVRRALAS